MSIKLKILIFLFTLLCIEFLLRQVYNPQIITGRLPYEVVDWLQMHVQLNSNGYRDKEYSFEKPENTYRIYTIGDSYTFGWYIDNPLDTYTRIIERGLQKKTPEKIEVINAAQWGFNFNEIVNRYLWEGKQYNPDLVLLGLSHYKVDVNNSKYRGRADAIFPQFIRDSRIYHLLAGQFFVRKADLENQKMFLRMYTDKNSPEWKEFETRITYLSREVRRSGSKLAILLFPQMYAPQPDAKYTFQAFHKNLHELGKKLDITIVDPLQAFTAYKNKSRLVLTPVDDHPSVELNKLVANEFLRQFSIPQERAFSKPTEIVTTDATNLTIGDYAYINLVKSQKDGSKLFYRELKYGNSQIFPLGNFDNSQTYIFPDRIEIADNNYPGPEMTYYLYPKEKGILQIPKTVHGYEIAGFVKFFGLTKKGAIPFNPKAIQVKDNNYIVSYDKASDFEVVKAHINISAKVLTIDEQNNIKSIVKTERIAFKLPGDSSTHTIPFQKNIVGYTQFDSSQQLKSIANAFPVIKTMLRKIGLLNSQTKLSPVAKKLFVANSGKMYAFINGVYQPAIEFTQEHGNLKLTFAKTLSKGTNVTFFVKVEENTTEFPLEISLVR